MISMKFRIFLMTMLATLPALSSFAQFRDGTSSYQELNDSEIVTSMRSNVRYLSSAMLEGRKSGSEGEAMAAEHVTEVLKAYGVDVLSPAKGELFGIKTEKGDTLTSRNVLAYVQGYDKVLRDRYIVIGARLDNIGTMTATVDGRQVERVFSGANGNASGLAVMMELARMIQTNSMMFRRSVLFVAFGASCDSFAGSWYFLNRSFSDVKNIDAMINLDMLGTGYEGFYAYTASNQDMNTLLKGMNSVLQPVLPDVVAEEPYPSDHRTFYSNEIPSVMFTTGRYSEHNTDRDTEAIIDYEAMERELEYIYNFSIALANTEKAPAFRQASLQQSGSANDDVVSFYDCDQRPIFLHSSDPKDFLQKWVYQYLKYPAEAVRDGIQGKVMVELIIEKDGSVTGVRVVKGVSEELNNEAVRVVAASPKWKPGRVNGNKVRTSLTIPVEFILEKKGAKSSVGIKKY